MLRVLQRFSSRSSAISSTAVRAFSTAAAASNNSSEREQLEDIYSKTLEVCAQLPVGDAYRKTTEKFTVFFLNKLVSSDSKESFETVMQEHGMENIHEAMGVAKKELDLAIAFRDNKF